MLISYFASIPMILSIIAMWLLFMLTPPAVQQPVPPVALQKEIFPANHFDTQPVPLTDLTRQFKENLELQKQMIDKQKILIDKVDLIERLNHADSSKVNILLMRAMAAGWLDLVCGQEVIRCLYVPPGEFQLGRTDQERINANLQTNGIFADNSVPRTHVIISEGFFLSETEITRSQFVSHLKQIEFDIAKNNQSKFPMQAGSSTHSFPVLSSPSFSETTKIPWLIGRKSLSMDEGKLPANEITWLEAYIMALWIQKWNGLSVRFPSEIEWEYAAKGRGNFRFPTADGRPYRPPNRNSPSAVKSDINDISWCGIRDMAGNVSEWCFESYTNDYKKFNSEVLMSDKPHVHNPSSLVLVSNYQSPPGGNSRVYRGGAFGAMDVLCESSNRNSKIETDRLSKLGFRLIVSLPSSILHAGIKR